MSVKEVNVLTCHLRYSGKQSFLHQHLFLIHSKKKIHRKTAKNEPLLWKRKGVGTSALIINKPAIDQSGSRHLQHRGVWKRWTFNVQLTETVIVNNLKLWLIKQCLACCMTLPQLTHTHTHICSWTTSVHSALTFQTNEVFLPDSVSVNLLLLSVNCTAGDFPALTHW